MRDAERLHVRNVTNQRRGSEDRQRPGKTRYRYFLGVKWSQVQILSARPLSCLGTSLTGVPGHGLHVEAVFRGVSAFDAAGLVVAGGVECEFADQCSGVVVQDADVEVVDEHDDFGAAAALAQSDVV